jgi:hypothetical protein
MAGIFASSWGTSLIKSSVVSIKPAIEAAFCRAERTVNDANADLTIFVLLTVGGLGRGG